MIENVRAGPAVAGASTATGAGAAAATGEGAAAGTGAGACEGMWFHTKRHMRQGFGSLFGSRRIS